MSSKPFNFELEAVLQVRHRDTEKASLRVAEAAEQVARQHAVIVALTDRLTTLIGDSSTPATDFLQMKRNSALQAQLRKRIEHERTILKRLEATESTAKAVLLECRMKEEAVTKLKEQAFERHKRQIEQAEDTIADELIAMAGARMARGI